MTIAPLRTRVLRLLGRSQRLTALTIRVAVAAARRRNADRDLVDRLARAPLPLDRKLQAIQWATALRDGAPFPKSFDPGDHLVDPADRRDAALHLRRHDDQGLDHRLVRQRIGVDDALPIDEVRALVAEDLTDRLATAAVAPKRGAAVAPEAQTRWADVVQQALEHHGIVPFLMSGSLLGVVRDGSFMPHDYDVDLGVLPGVELADACAALRERHDLDVQLIGPRLEISCPDGVKIDLFEHTERDGRFWHATQIHEWWNTPFALTRRDVAGTTFWIPDDPELYLAENYGPWRAPVAFYDISFDTPNRRYRQTHEALRYLYSRCVRGLERNDRWLLESAVRELRDAFGIDVSQNLAPSALLERGVSAPSVGARPHQGDI